jgi:hypothetical protein
VAKVNIMENTTTSLKESIKDYVETQIDVIKLKAINQGSSIVAGIAVGVAMAVLGFLILIFLGLSAAVAISAATAKPFLGYLIVAGFFILLAVAVVLLKDKLITLPLINTLMQKIYYKAPPKENDGTQPNGE